MPSGLVPRSKRSQPCPLIILLTLQGELELVIGAIRNLRQTCPLTPWPVSGGQFPFSSPSCLDLCSTLGLCHPEPLAVRPPFPSYLDIRTDLLPTVFCTTIRNIYCDSLFFSSSCINLVPWLWAWTTLASHLSSAPLSSLHLLTTAEPPRVVSSTFLFKCPDPLDVAERDRGCVSWRSEAGGCDLKTVVIFKAPSKKVLQWIPAVHSCVQTYVAAALST